MPTSSLRMLATVAALIFAAATAHAAQPFDAKAFEQAQASGKTILIDVTAPWCPTCRKQRPILAEVQKERPALVAFEVDFDSAKETLRRFKVQSQSTLIVFKGATEVGRSTGQTDPAQIRDLIAKGF